MNTDRPDLNQDEAASALPDPLDADAAKNDGQKPDPGHRPTGQDVTDGEEGQPIEPPD